MMLDLLLSFKIDVELVVRPSHAQFEPRLPDGLNEIDAS